MDMKKNRYKNAYLKIIRRNFICDDDYTKFDMVAAMLFYTIFQVRHIAYDDMHYMDDSSDPDRCHDTFRMIFQLMEQEQYFEMMTGIS